MRQDSFSVAGFEKFRKKTRKEQFLEEMEAHIPCQDLIEVIRLFRSGAPSC
jgi:IS5 family transposase